MLLQLVTFRSGLPACLSRAVASLVVYVPLLTEPRNQPEDFSAGRGGNAVYIAEVLAPKTFF